MNVPGRLRYSQHFVLIAAALCLCASTSLAADRSLPLVAANDNTRPAGRLERGTLTVALRAAVGRWQPEGTEGPAVEIEAFGEVGGSLMVPAPLLRVAEGTQISISIRNELESELVVHGLCTRGGTSCAPMRVLPQQSRETRFITGPPGTYHYWASTIGAPIPFRELAGAFVVDRAGGAERDRILAITEWSNLTARQLGQIITSDSPTETFVSFKPRVTFVINGLSWPATERFAYDLGEPVRWRVVNLSSQPHPLHLHGFYFEVGSLGNGQTDTVFSSEQRRRVVTQLLPPGGTMTMTWVPERAGNWLFHCHIMHHVSEERRIAKAATASEDHGSRGHGSHAGTQDGSLGMAGMVIGVTIRARAPGADASEPTVVARRKLTLVMGELYGSAHDGTAAGFVLRDGSTPSVDRPTAPGPTIVLRNHEPVDITLVNQLAEATSIHWHGMELESYYDGVHGWSGAGRQVTPLIEPGGTFVVRFTPPRTGTFIYHTHLHDYRQLSSGLYGPLIVVDADETFDPARDHVIVLGRSGLTSEEPSILTDPSSVVINGERRPRLVWQSGARHRVRLINITPDDIFTVTLQTTEGPVSWTPLAKDGASLPPGHRASTPARQTIAVGETYDFEFDAPPGRKIVWLEVRTPGGKWQAQGEVLLR